MFRILHIPSGEYLYKDCHGNLFLFSEEFERYFPCSVVEYHNIGKASNIFNGNRVINRGRTEQIRLGKENNKLFCIVEV